ncbi:MULTISPECIES: MmgE/PrpD family protein [unclassified Adlercreutzia]|uniref:MmgE/PrpD family protein n=1 Tax=unclassified Adlercreutzia TaxID=2636013 RepID=UPI0013EC0ECC|nr:MULTISPECIES: MmgE/PrpD family protein [unclassified Adlercreutzia]
MNKTDALIDHFLETRYDDLDQETVRRTKTRILDSFGVTVVGTSGPACASVHEMLCAKGGVEEATVLGFGRKLPAESAAFINALMARSFDFDAVMSLTDDGRSKPAHISACSATAAIVATERNARTGKELICALALGDDFAARLNACSGGGPHDIFDNTGTISGMSAVVACAKLYGLDKEQFKNALGIMVNSLSGSMGNVDEYNLCFKYPIANAARNAILAIELAKAGVGSLDDPVFGPKCFFDMFGSKYDVEHFFDTLGESYLSDIVIKPWASCRMTHAGIDAVLTASKGQPLHPDEVASITISLHPKAPDFVIDDFEFGEESQVHGAFNLKFTAATAALSGRVRPESYTREAMSYNQVREMLDLLSFDRDESLPSVNTARARITLTSGEVLLGNVDVAPLGDMVLNPLSDQDILSKFILNVTSSGMISKEAARNAADLLLDLESQGSLNEIIALLIR